MKMRKELEKAQALVTKGKASRHLGNVEKCIKCT